MQIWILEESTSSGGGVIPITGLQPVTLTKRLHGNVVQGPFTINGGGADEGVYVVETFTADPEADLCEQYVHSKSRATLIDLSDAANHIIGGDPRRLAIMFISI